MKKMYILTLCIIAVITAGFLLFYCDENSLNRRFLSSYGIETQPEPVDTEEIQIPEEFDEIYENYNLLQIESGLDLSPYKGKKAIRCTYRVLNFPEDIPDEILANVICVNHRPIAGDIMCPSLNGFIQPLVFLQSHK